MGKSWSFGWKLSHFWQFKVNVNSKCVKFYLTIQNLLLVKTSCAPLFPSEWSECSYVPKHKHIHWKVESAGVLLFELILFSFIVLMKIMRVNFYSTLSRIGLCQAIVASLPLSVAVLCHHKSTLWREPKWQKSTFWGEPKWQKLADFREAQKWLQFIQWFFLSVMCHQDGLPFKRYIIRNKSEENRSYTE